MTNLHYIQTILNIRWIIKSLLIKRKKIPFIEDVTLHFMELISKEATGLERHAASLSGPTTEWQAVYQFFHYSPSASWGFQTFIILLFYSNCNCPTSAPMINKLHLKVDQDSTAQHRKKDIDAPKSLCTWMHQGEHAFADKQDSWLLVIDNFHAAVLLNPKLTNNDVVDTTGRICPGVGFIISAEKKKKKQRVKTWNNMRWHKAQRESNQTYKAVLRLCTHLGSSSVMSPLGSASMLFPQNLSLG